MLTLVRPAGPAKKRQSSMRRCAWNDLPEPPKLRLVGASDDSDRTAPQPGPTAEQREVLSIAVDRMIDDALRQLTIERARARARLATADAAPAR